VRKKKETQKHPLILPAESRQREGVAHFKATADEKGKKKNARRPQPEMEVSKGGPEKNKREKVTLKIGNRVGREKKDFDH